MLAAIFGLSGPVLTADERRFFADADPAGYILFARNVVDKAQLTALTDALRGLTGRDDLPILIDQEGGRIARLEPPLWPEFPAAARFADLYERAPISGLEAARANAHAIALILAEVGISVNCLPVLDVRQPGAHDIIGDRALGADPLRVASLGRAVLDGLKAGGVIGVVKHIPGHGRALADSHQELPVVDADAEALEVDIRPFARLNDAPMAMTAHVVYRAWDPDRPATLSPTIIADIIRGRIGFDGFLMSDDIDMKALTGSPGEKAAAAVAAGCDVALDCWARMADMVEIAGAVGPLSDKGRRRLDAAMASAGQAEEGWTLAELEQQRDRMLAYA